jgi:hypothetical protein
MTDEDEDGDDGDYNEKQESSGDHEPELGMLFLKMGEAGFEGVGCEAGGVDVGGDGGELFALVVELAVEAGVGGGDLSEVATKACGHLFHGGA